MKKKMIITIGCLLLSILLMLIIVVGVKKIIGEDIIDMDDVKEYTIEIAEIDKIEKILYQYPNGDVYEIVDARIIQSFVECANGVCFEKGEYLGDSSWSSSAIYLCDAEGKYLHTIAPYGEKSIVYGDGPNVYTSDNGYGLELLTDKGTYVRNIYK